MTVIKLDKTTRAGLPDTDFAVPSKRKLPINDAHHVRQAWGVVDNVQGLTAEERHGARQAILARAEEFSIDTSAWHSLTDVTFECLSLNISTNDDHPNKMPFSGVLTRVDQPSDGAPGGSGGKKIILKSEAARAALPSLMGMAVNYMPSFDGHDVQNKIGIITSADVVGSELQIAGFIYAADFPETTTLIKSLKSDLGFSFEAHRIYVEDMSAAVLSITQLHFTGAAILLKDKAAYTSTSLAANAAQKDVNDMNKEEFLAMLAEAVKPFNDRFTKIEAALETVLTASQAAAKIRNDVEPHAVALDNQATALEAVGIDATAIRKMASDMRAEAAAGRMPTKVAAATTPVVAAPAAQDAAIAAMIAEALKPVQNQLEEATTKLKDAEAAGRLSASAPARKTVGPGVQNVLSKSGLTLPTDEGAKLNIADVDKALASANIGLQQRIMLKNELGRIGAM
jgi:hypothetical protein